MADQKVRCIGGGKIRFEVLKKEYAAGGVADEAPAAAADDLCLLFEQVFLLSFVIVFCLSVSRLAGRFSRLSVSHAHL